MTLDELKQYFRHGVVCVDVRFDKATNILRATEIIRLRKKNLEIRAQVSLDYFIFMPLSHLPSNEVYNVETAASVVGEYIDLDAAIGPLEVFLGKPIQKWHNHTRHGYEIDLEFDEESAIRQVDWPNWLPQHNELMVPVGTDFEIRKPNDWKNKVSLVQDTTG